MSPPTDSAKRTGFTLLELTISMALLGMVMLLVYGAFGQISTRARELGEELNERQELRLLMRLVSDDLGSAQWLDRFSDKTSNPATGISSDTEFRDGQDFSRIRFHAARPARFHRRLPGGLDPALHEVEYQVRPVEGEKGLELVRREDFYLDDDLTEGGVSVVVAENIVDFLVEFLPPDYDRNAFEEPWQKRWEVDPSVSNQQRMPVAIRLTLGRRAASGKVLREVIEINLQGSLNL